MAPPFHHPEKIEGSYRRAINKLMSAVLPSPKASDLLLKLEKLGSDFEIAQLAEVLARKMVHSVNTENARSWRAVSARSRRMYNLLQKEMGGSIGQRVRGIVSDNARLISSVPLEVATQLSHELLRAQQQGSRPETIAKMLQERYPQIAESRVSLIARTETSKASTALTRARSEDLDLEWFEWETSEDQRVRYSHRNLDHVLVRWQDLPSPEKLAGEKSTLGHYAPGDAPNCRCYPKPLLSVDDVSWPHRVYTGGEIIRMTRAQFLNLAGAPGRRIAA